MVRWLFREETHHDAGTAATRNSRQELEDHQHGDELRMCFCAWGTSFSLLWELLLLRFSSFFYLFAGFTGFRPFQGGIAYCTADGDHKLRTINLSS
jgi:hypothetical protein